MVGFSLFSNPIGGPASPKFAARPVAGAVSAKTYRLGGATGGGNLTHSLLVNAEGPFTGGKLYIFNTTSSAQTVTAACVAPSAVANDDINPLNGAGSAQAWTVIGGGPWTVPAADVTGTSGVPGILEIPFTLASIPRTDNAAYPPLLMARIYALTTGGLTAATPLSAEIDAFNTAVGPARRLAVFWKGGDFVTTPSGFTAPTKGLVAISAVQFTCAAPARVVLGGGDSISQGVNATSVYYPAGARACAALSTLAAPLSFTNCGVSGATMIQSLQALEVYIARFTPHIVIIPCFSPNDAQVAAVVNASFTAAMGLANKCRASGMQPVLWTPIPHSVSAGTDALRLAIVAAVKASGFPYADYDAALTDGASPARIAAPYNSGDNVHPNEAGQALMGTILQAVLAKL